MSLMLGSLTCWGVAGRVEAERPPQFVGVSPARLLDTRPRGLTIDGVAERDGAVDSGSTIHVPVAGRGGIPAQHVAAVAINVTATDASSTSYITAFPSGSPRPLASNLNIFASGTFANMAIVPLGADGGVDLYNNHGTVQLVVDVLGWFPEGSSLTSVSPRRLLDTRAEGATVDGAAAGAGQVVEGENRRVPIAGRGGVPADAAAVVVNVTATGSRWFSYVTAFPSGRTLPTASNLNLRPGSTVANMSIVPVGVDGSIDLYNNAGATDLIVDVLGWFGAAADQFVPTSPTRYLDTRELTATVVDQTRRGRPVGPGESIDVTITGRDVVPAGASGSVVVNVTATEAFVPSYVTAFPTGTARPNASNLNQDGFDATANMAIVPVSSTGQITLYNNAGSTQLIVDVIGWLPGEPFIPTPAPTRPPPEDRGGANVGPLTSPDVGTVCAPSLGAAGLAAAFDRPIGAIDGFDYQRGIRLPDDRVLWLVQDAWVDTGGGHTLVHNAAVLQSGRCFTPLVGGSPSSPASWVLADHTQHMQHWYWPFGGEVSPDGSVLHVLYAEMTETGPSYLTHTFLSSMVLVDIRLPDLAVVGARPAPNASPDGYGFSVASDRTYSYLYSNCHRQFGFSEYGHAPCAADAKVGRVPRGRLDVAPEYWNGTTWTPDPAQAVAVISSSTIGYSVNPAQIRVVDGMFELIEKVGDWNGYAVVTQYASKPQGPWSPSATEHDVRRCPDCTTYFASWVPWNDPVSGEEMYVISNNEGDGRPTRNYRPTVFTLRW